jgi:hypothetical protein
MNFFHMKSAPCYLENEQLAFCQLYSGKNLFHHENFFVSRGMKLTAFTELALIGNERKLGR